MHNFNVDIVDCSYVFRLLQNKHHQDVYREYTKKIIVVVLAKKFKRHFSWVKTFVV